MKSNPIATPTLAQYVSENIDTGIVQEFEVSVNLFTKHINFLFYMYILFMQVTKEYLLIICID